MNDQPREQNKNISPAHKKLYIILAVFGVVILAAGGYLLLYVTNQVPKSCRTIDTSGPELTFEMNYCIGGGCYPDTQEVCEAIDIVNEKIEAGADGKPDCEWVDNYCQPNK